MKYLIVGQGLAGTLLAHRLEEEAVDYKIIDSGINESSRVAAGIINPIVFRRVTKSWLVDECMPEAVAMYRNLEQQLNTRFLYERTIRRAFSSEQEVELWKKKSTDAGFTAYIQHPDKSSCPPNYINAPFGNGMVTSVYYVDTKIFIDANRAYFQRCEKLIEGDFNDQSITSSGCEINGEHFDRIIFCQGYKGKENPYFESLPLNATKGQILDLEIEGVTNNREILNRKCFILPMENGSYKAGATYEWHSPNTQITEAAKQELSEKIAGLIHVPYKIVGQEAGVRPTTIDRRPLMGRHPKMNNLYIFNGLGTKGYLLAPLLSGQMAAFILHNSDLDIETDITRFN